MPGPADAAAAGALLAGDGATAALSPSDALTCWLEDADELAPVAAVLGGVIGNEVVKVVSRQKEPARNFFCYSLADGAGAVVHVH
jgi:ubiquitin-like 1-activating enzyme E1 A